MEIIGTCCVDKDASQLCTSCKLDMMLYFISNKEEVLEYLKEHNQKLYRQVKSAAFRL